jgi:hypothetical protein
MERAPMPRPVDEILPLQYNYDTDGRLDPNPEGRNPIIIE